MFVIIAICEDAPFCHLFVDFCQTFDNFFTNWSSSENLSLSWKWPTINMPLFVISFEYLAKPLLNFWHTHHICRNLSIFPSLSPQLRFYQIVGRFLPIFPDLPFLWKSSTVNMPVLLSHCLNPCQIRRYVSQNMSFSLRPQLATCLFCHLVSMFAKSQINFFQVSHFRKIASCQDAPFVISSEYLAKPLMNFWHTPFLPKFAFFS